MVDPTRLSSRDCAENSCGCPRRIAPERQPHALAAFCAGSVHDHTLCSRILGRGLSDLGRPHRQQRCRRQRRRELPARHLCLPASGGGARPIQVERRVSPLRDPLLRGIIAPISWPAAGFPLVAVPETATRAANAGSEASIAVDREIVDKNGTKHKKLFHQPTVTPGGSWGSCCLVPNQGRKRRPQPQVADILRRWYNSVDFDTRLLR